MNMWFRRGEHWIWLHAATVSINIIAVVGLLGLILVRGMGHFWPSDVYSIQYENHETGKTETIAGSIVDEIVVHDDATGKERRRYFVKVANRKLYGLDFRWLWYDQIQQKTIPPELVVLERTEWGDFYGYFHSLNNSSGTFLGDEGWRMLAEAQKKAGQLSSALHSIAKNDIGAINARMENIRLQKRKLELEGEDTPSALAQLQRQQEDMDGKYQVSLRSLEQLTVQLHDLGEAVFVSAEGTQVTIALRNIVHFYAPNTMNVAEKILAYFYQLWKFLSSDPREANTEGGVFPAIFGTVMMVFLMTLITTPFGVIAAIYLREYAKQGIIVRLIRISVNNLAGVPSIVYGVFGLGFFVYFLGGNIDKWFYPEALPAPTFGSPGLLWASFTLALLTLPVVIVSTEEGLARIPIAIREGSLSLGATHFETIRHIVIPMASPAIITGVILAIARAAGEVAPLMLVGVVKLAPDLAVDAIAPYVHLERQFMHLGFHIFDLGFQSPNVDAARPLVFATSFVLVVVIVLLNLTAIWIRNRLRERYKQLDQ